MLTQRPAPAFIQVYFPAHMFVSQSIFSCKGFPAFSPSVLFWKCGINYTSNSLDCHCSSYDCRINLLLAMIMTEGALYLQICFAFLSQKDFFSNTKIYSCRCHLKISSHHLHGGRKLGKACWLKHHLDQKIASHIISRKKNNNSIPCLVLLRLFLYHYLNLI